uniref:Uncharacterized protein n=1 Tax=Marseillevirus sp. TaxID=2809551 RepID=A0AA96J0W8_9VIRU|nr:hypothetical protein MarDSR_033 [Marseillevirus sp.]
MSSKNMEGDTQGHNDTRRKCLVECGRKGDEYSRATGGCGKGRDHRVYVDTPPHCLCPKQ